MAQRKYHVTEALARNKAEINELLLGGECCDYAHMGPLALSEAVPFRGRKYGQVTINAFVSVDPPHEQSPDELSRLSPSLSLMLQASSGEPGIVMRVDYGEFGLSPSMWERFYSGEFPDILVPETFNVYQGENFLNDDRRLGGGDIGSFAETGEVARLAASTIDAACLTVRAAGFAVLAREYDY